MNPRSTAGNLILVRHTSVAAKFRSLCYGRSDIPLGTAGKQHSRQVAKELAAYAGATVFHSGLQRTRFLAEQLADYLDCLPVCCEALRERDFGTWELKPWNAIHGHSGDEMLRMISEPETYRPGGGETTFELRDRVVAWRKSATAQKTLVVAVTHGGPIAALLGTEKQLPVSDWVKLIPGYGEWVRLSNEICKQG